MSSETELLPEYDFSQGVRSTQKDKYFLNLAGEFFVAAELNRRGVYAAVTYGAAKNADVIAIDQQTNQTAVLEVKTTAFPNRKWLTGQNSLNTAAAHPHLFWVLVLLPAQEQASAAPRYFVLTSGELTQKVSKYAQEYSARYETRHSTPFDQMKGVYSLTLQDAEEMQCEDRWDKIVQWLVRK